MDNIDSLKKLKGQIYVFLNVRSLYCHLNELQIDFENTKFILLGLCETWLTNNMPDSMINLRGYIPVRLDREVLKKGGGVMFYVRHDITWQLLERNGRISNNNIEILTIVLSRKFQSKLYVSIVYIPPKSNLNNAFIDLDSVANEIGNNDWIIGGDFNIDLTKTSGNNASKLKSNFTYKFSLKQLVTTPTRISASSASLIDHLYVSNNEDIASSGVITYGLSDHNLTYICIKKMISDSLVRETFSCRNMKYYSRDLLNQNLREINWDKFYLMQDPNLMWAFMYNSYLAAAEATAPTCTLKDVKPKKSWVTADLLTLIRERDEHKAKADSLNGNQHFETFKRTRNKVRRLVYKAKRDFIKTRINNAGKDSKKYWSELKEILPTGKRKSNDRLHIDLQTENRDSLTSTQIPDYTNNFFVSVGKKLADKITTDNKEYRENISQCNPLQNNMLASWDPIREAELELLVRDININKSSNIKDISTRIIKDCFLLTIKQTAFLFNQICNVSIFPTAWKEALVVPLFKGGNKLLISNYRPISLLPVIAKLLEKLLHKRLYSFLADSNFFSNCQCGFRPLLGVENSIDKLLQYTYNSFNGNKFVLTIFYDLCKAFDTIDHGLLLDKLKGAGLSSKPLKLMTDYLSNRSQRCIVNNIISNSNKIICGVPQGSTLGPLLFIIYINDMVNYIKNVEISLYADDTAFYLASNNISHLNSELSIAAMKFKEWCDLNKLTVNYNKSKVLLLSSHTAKKTKLIRSQINVNIHGFSLSVVKEYKYLGFILDERLLYHDHLEMIKHKISQRKYLLKKIRWSIGFRDALLLYKSSILPFIDLGCIFYVACDKARQQSLQTLQNRCLRAIIGRKLWSNTTDAHTLCKLQTVGQRQKLFLLKFGHKLSFKPSNLVRHQARTLRSARKTLLHKVRPNNSKYEKSYINLSITYWNMLPEDMKKIRDVQKFRTRICKEMILGNINFPE